MIKAEERIQWILDAKNNEQLAAYYDEWAQSYEQDMVGTFSYTAPAHLLPILDRYVAPDAHILDVAAGTGLIGQAMYQAGYRTLTALDMSESMLEIAREKEVYQAFALGVLGEPLNLPSNSFDTLVSIGVFTLGHAPASAFHELVRLIKPGGFIIFSLHASLVDDFQPTFDAITAAGNWQLREIGDEIFFMPEKEPEVGVQMWVYEVM